MGLLINLIQDNHKAEVTAPGVSCTRASQSQRGTHYTSVMFKDLDGRVASSCVVQGNLRSLEYHKNNQHTAEPAGPVDTLQCQH